MRVYLHSRMHSSRCELVRGNTKDSVQRTHLGKTAPTKSKIFDRIVLDTHIIFVVTI